MTRQLQVTALGGGHGLHASLSALRRLDVGLTAVVTVADDGGSSGRIRRELGILPPGDLRMALAALAGDDPAHREWAEVYQHRFGGYGALAGHPVGNLVLSGLLERLDPVTALAVAGDQLGAVGRVLPMSPAPLDLQATVDRFDADDPVRRRRIRGQSSIASTVGRVRHLEIVPPDAPSCADAVTAVLTSDVVVLGPGSWFTSVIPHLLLPDLGAALSATPARVVVTLNLVPQAGETDEFSPAEHLRVLRQYRPDLRLDVVVADEDAVDDHRALRAACDELGARLVLGSVRSGEYPDRHDPGSLARCLAEVLRGVSHRRRPPLEDAPAPDMSHASRA